MSSPVLRISVTLAAFALVATTGTPSPVGAAPSAFGPISSPVPRIPVPIRFRRFGVRTVDGPLHRADAAQAVAIQQPDTVVSAGFVTTGDGFGIDLHAWQIEKRRWDGSVIWQQTSPFRGDATAVAVRPSDGSVVAAGYKGVISGLSIAQMAVAKWSNDGVLLWSAEIDGADGHGGMQDCPGEARGVALTSNGDVAVVGHITNVSLDAGLNAYDDQDAVVVLLDGSTGAEKWRQLIKGNRFAQSDWGNAIAVDLNDHIVAVGSVKNSGADRDIFIASFDTAGNAWFPRLNLAGNANGEDEATSVAVDGQNQIYVGGYRTNLVGTTANKDLWIGKFAGNGAALFQRDVAGSVSGGEDRALAVGCDTAGNLYAAGFTTNTGSPSAPAGGPASMDLTVGKWNGVTGNAAWTQKLDGGANGDDRARAIAVLPSGDLAVGGHLSGAATGRDFAMLRYSTAGAQIWSYRFDGTLHQNDACNAVAIDGTNWAVGAGVTRNTGTIFVPGPSTDADFTVAM